MNDPTDGVGALFLQTASSATDLIASTPVTSAWDSSSALDGYTVGALCGHLARAVTTVEEYLDREPPEGDVPLVDAAEYFHAVLGSHDPVDSELHRTIRARGAETASQGVRSLASTLQDAVGRLQPHVEGGSLTRAITVRDDLSMTLGEYLRTRLVELVVHLDDVAVSVPEAEPVKVPSAAYVEVAGVLGRLAALRAGGLPTVRSLARSERQQRPVRAL